MKYIVLQVMNKNGMHLEVPFVFPEILVHAMMSQVCTALCKATWKGSDVIPISAGFLSSMSFEDACYGESTSLKLKSRGVLDDKLIKMCDYGAMNA